MPRPSTAERLLSAPVMVLLMVFNQFQKAMGGSPVGGVGVEEGEAVLHGGELGYHVFRLSGCQVFRVTNGTAG